VGHRGTDRASHDDVQPAARAVAICGRDADGRDGESGSVCASRSVRCVCAQMGNFVNTIVEKQLDPTGLVMEEIWMVCSNTWNVIFIFELLWNMYGCWYIST
jgi:hypothetical protein